jgi:hypothetical protein
MIATRIRECWCSDNSIDMLPDGKVFVIAGPNETAVMLKKHHKPVEDYFLQSNHIEADTRIFIHCQAISYENINSIMLQASDTDIMGESMRTQPLFGKVFFFDFFFVQKVDLD